MSSFAIIISLFRPIPSGRLSMKTYLQKHQNLHDDKLNEIIRFFQVIHHRSPFTDHLQIDLNIVSRKYVRVSVVSFLAKRNSLVDLLTDKNLTKASRSKTTVTLVCTRIVFNCVSLISSLFKYGETLLTDEFLA